MGILDTPAASNRGPNPLIQKLRRGLENCALAVLGDSTGNDTFEWVYLTAQNLAAKYPAHTVQHRLWNDTNQNYDAATTIQTGTAIPAITDAFTRADGALGDTPTGQTWSAGAYAISGNKAVASSAGTSMTVDTGYSDHTGSVDITFAANKGTFSDSSARITFRSQGANDYVYAQFGVTDTGTYFTLSKKVNGASTNYASSTTAAITYGSTKTVTWSVIGNALSVTVGGVTLTGTISGTDVNLFSNATTVGFGDSGNYLNGFAIDNVSIAPQAPVFTVWNASTSGKACAYSQTRLTLQLPAHPDLTIISYGHNEAGNDVRPQYLQLVRSVMDLWPRTSFAFTMQNARANTTSSYKQGLLKNRSIAALAANLGVDLIDVTSAYLAYPNYSTALIDWGDGLGLHPNAAGQQVWAGVVQKALLEKNAPPVAPATQRAPQRVWVPASAFIAAEGSPVLGIVNGGPAWALDQATQMSVTTTADIPNDWLTFNVYAVWNTAAASGFTGSTNTVVWELLLGQVMDALGTQKSPATTNPALASQGTVNGSASNTGTAYISYATLLRGASPLPGRPLTVQVRRVAASGSDSLAANVNLVGVIIERAS